MGATPGCYEIRVPDAKGFLRCLSAWMTWIRESWDTLGNHRPRPDMDLWHFAGVADNCRQDEACASGSPNAQDPNRFREEVL